MKKDWKYWTALIACVIVVGAIFSIGIFNNPDFTIHDFCLGLSTEIVGVVVVLVFVDRYANLKIERREKREQNKKENDETRSENTPRL